MMILPYALGICMVAITLSMLLCLYRLIIGPSIVDRLLALDTLFLNAIILSGLPRSSSTCQANPVPAMNIQIIRYSMDFQFITAPPMGIDSLCGKNLSHSDSVK